MTQEQLKRLRTLAKSAMDLKDMNGWYEDGESETTREQDQEALDALDWLIEHGPQADEITMDTVLELNEDDEEGGS